MTRVSSPTVLSPLLPCEWLEYSVGREIQTYSVHVPKTPTGHTGPKEVAIYGTRAGYGGDRAWAPRPRARAVRAHATRA